MKMQPGCAHVAALLFVCLSLSCVLGTQSTTIYARLNASVNIDIPDIRLAKDDMVKWTRDDSVLIDKSKLETGVKVAGFTIFTNGTLQVTRLLVPKRRFSVEVHNKDGRLRKTCSFTLIGIEPLSQPTISHKCKEVLEFSCSVARGQADTLEVLVDGHKEAEGKSAMTVAGNTTINMERKMLLKCVVKNNVSEESDEVSIVCPTELDILLIACIAGAAVIVIVFVVLLIYCVLRCYEQHCSKQISEEEVELPSMMAPQKSRQRRLPDPRNQPTCPPHHHLQPQHQLLQQRKRPQHMSSSHPKMMEDQPMMQQKMLQGQAGSKQNKVQGQAKSHLNRQQVQTALHQKMVQGQAISQPHIIQDQPMSRQKRQEGQPAAPQRMLRGQPVQQHMVQVYAGAASQQQQAQGQLPQLPPHHPSSVSQDTIPRPLPHAQCRP